MVKTAPAWQFRFGSVGGSRRPFGKDIQVGVIHFAFLQPLGLEGLVLFQQFHTEIVKVNRAGFHAFGTVLYQRLVFFDINILLISASLKKHESHKLI